MSVAAALILFSALMTIVCARARAAGPALLAGVFCVVVLGTTPLGQGLLGVIGDAGDRVDQAAATVSEAR